MSLFRIFFALAGAVAVYGFFIEPNWLETTHFEVSGKVSRPLKIAHLTDLHLHKFGLVEEKVIDAIRAESPDIILITGDLLDGDSSVQAARKFFSHLTAPLGIWAVLGNWEVWKHLDDKKLFDSLNVHLLRNEEIRVNSELTLVGFDDYEAGTSYRGTTSVGMPLDGYCISLFHSPQLVEELGGKCPLALAGHTHGGQVRIPFLRPFWLPHGSGPFVHGWYNVNGTKLYVGRGIGTSILPIRLFARPEITFITIKSS